MSKIQIDGSLEQYWQEQIQLRQESGLSRAVYCEKHDLSYHKFVYWEQKKVQHKKSQLLPVKLIPTQDCDSGAKSKLLYSILRLALVLDNKPLS